MPKITVTIEWDKPDEPHWLNPHNVSLALHAYCANTHFVVWNAEVARASNKELELARDLRYSVVQQQYNAGNLMEDEALELLRGRLSPDDPSTVCDDSSRLVVKLWSI